MPVLTPGLVHTPVTPFSHDGGIALEVYGKLLDFHVANGAQSLALPMHIGESVSLTDGERRALLEFAIARIGDRIPVLAHVSESGSAIAAALARHAEKAGAAAVIATTPYYWTPPATMLIEHFVAIGAATPLPFLIYNAPEEMQGAR
ncbi:MAG TPA: dihydrodipicolinate synthase family protein, partial [Xanthobacteraceae bacterium]